MENTIICGDYEGKIADHIDFNINKMSREAYNYLSSIGYLSSADHQYDLFLIDDENFDVQNKKIVNVGDPDSNSYGDGVNVGYLQDKYISQSEIINYSTGKIVTKDLKKCLSSDCCVYTKLSEDWNWEIVVVSGDVEADKLSVRYDTSSQTLTEHGWAFYDQQGNVFYTSLSSRDEQKIRYISQYRDTIIYGYREKWALDDILISRNQISNCLSTLQDNIDDNTIENIFNCLSSIKKLVDSKS